MNADTIGKPTTYRGFIFGWKAADTADVSIIAYGSCNYVQYRKPDQKRLYKIVFKANKYWLYYRAGRGYWLIDKHNSLELAQQNAQDHWVDMWLPKPTKTENGITEVEFEEVDEHRPAFTVTGTVENLGSMSGNLIIQGHHGVVNYINNDGKVEQMEIKAISADLSGPNTDPVQSDILYNTINPEQFCEKLTILAFRASVFLNADYDVLPLPFAQGMVTGLIKQINAYRSAYHALNKPSTDLQTRLDIAASLTQYES